MKHFIYTDTDIVNSYLSQINDGLVKKSSSESGYGTKKENSESFSPGETSSESSINIKLFKFKSKNNSDIESTTNTLSKSKYGKELIEKILHDNALEQFINYLKKEELLKELDNASLNDLELGDYISLKSSYSLVDFEHLVRIYDNKFIDFLMKQFDTEVACTNLKTPIKNQKRTVTLNQHKNTQEIFNIMNSILPNLKFLHGDNWLAMLDEKFLRDSIMNIRFKYTGKINIIAKCTNDFNGFLNKPHNTSDLNEVFKLLDQTIYNFFKITLGTNENIKILIPIALYFE